MNDANIYEGERLRLTALDPANDPEVEAGWSHTPDFLALFNVELQRPTSAHQLKKRYEEREKNHEDDAYEFDLRIRLRADDRLIGVLLIWAEWGAGNAWLRLGIGQPEDRRHGYGREALALGLRYIFDEMNLRRDGVDQDILVMGMLRHEWPPAAAQVLRIHHAQVCFPSAELDRARAFYLELLGLREIDKPESLKDRGGFWAEVGGQQLHVSPEEGVDRTRTKAHIAWQVRALAAWRAKLEAAGCATLDSIPIPGYDRFEARDPFGNRIEFIQVAA